MLTNTFPFHIKARFIIEILMSSVESVAGIPQSWSCRPRPCRPPWSWPGPRPWSGAPPGSSSSAAARPRRSDRHHRDQKLCQRGYYYRSFYGKLKKVWYSQFKQTWRHDKSHLLQCWCHTLSSSQGIHWSRFDRSSFSLRSWPHLNFSKTINLTKQFPGEIKERILKLQIQLHFRDWMACKRYTLLQLRSL